MGNPIKIEDLVDVAKKQAKGIVQIILEKNFDHSNKRIIIEDYFTREGIVCYFKGEGVEKEGDYTIDLTQIDIIY